MGRIPLKRWILSGKTVELESEFELDFSNPKQVLLIRKNNSSDALSTALSALYAKVLVVMGIAMPVTEILSSKIPTKVYQGFYLYLYTGSICFVCFVYAVHMRTRAVFSLIKSYRK